MSSGPYTRLVINGSWDGTLLDNAVARRLIREIRAEASADGLPIKVQGAAVRLGPGHETARRSAIERLLRELDLLDQLAADYSKLRQTGAVVRRGTEDLWAAAVIARAHDDGLRCAVSYEMYLNDIVAATHIELRL